MEQLKIEPNQSNHQGIIFKVCKKHRIKSLELTTKHIALMADCIDEYIASQPPAVKGAEWVKIGATTDPVKTGVYKVRSYDTLHNDGGYLYGSCAYNNEVEEWNANWDEWYNESPTAAGEVSCMRKEDYEQIEINIDGGMAEAEACFQSGFTAGHDAGYAKAKDAAGDGKGVSEFIAWLFPTDFSQISEDEWQNNAGVRFTTAQLYDIFKNKNQ